MRMKRSRLNFEEDRAREGPSFALLVYDTC
jgi:hypothetical protein